MNRLPFALGLALLAVSPSLADGQASPRGPRPITVEDVFRIAGVSSPVVSPDGRDVAYVVSTRDLDDNSSRSDVWMVPVEGGEPRRMTSSESSASEPAFSPDGRYLTFLATRGDGARQQVWALDIRGGEARALTDVEEGVSGYAWSPDARRLALLIRDPAPEREDGAPRPPWVVDRLQFKQDYRGYLDRRRTHLYVLELETDSLLPLSEGDYDHSGIAWSPDGRRIAFVSNRTEEPDANYDTDVWVVPADVPTPDPERVSTSAGGDSSPTWSPDGRSLAWLTSIRPEIGGYAMSHLAVAPLGGEARVLSEPLDNNVWSPEFSADGRAVLGRLEAEGSESLISIALDGGGVDTLFGGERSAAAFAPVPGGGFVVAASTADAPRELFFVGASGSQRRLTRHNDALLAELELGPVRAEWLTAPDGTRLEAYYTFPPPGLVGEASGDLPTILWIHGGPMGQDGWAWHALRHVFAAKGYLVVQPNYRGSHGYGQDFAVGLWQNWGGPEPMDAVASVDHAIALGWADPERLGVGGWSYGGITTNGIITGTDRFRAAVSGAGAALHVASWGHDQYQRWYAGELGLPWENRELWDRVSTFWQVDRITTPTLWIGGELDWNVPISQSELMYQSMKRLGRETLLVVYPGQHHGGFPPVYEADRYRRFLGWFGRYLLGDDSDWPEG
jgi:dipeptidyl aminopeptidase/acylaminoacyl peptidase